VATALHVIFITVKFRKFSKKLAAWSVLAGYTGFLPFFQAFTEVPRQSSSGSDSIWESNVGSGARRQASVKAEYRIHLSPGCSPGRSGASWGA